MTGGLGLSGPRGHTCHAASGCEMTARLSIAGRPKGELRLCWREALEISEVDESRGCRQS